jgi:hypothetical protein
MTFLDSAMRNAAVDRDARGLMPLEAARALVASTDRFERGDPIPGTHVLASDRCWAALLSLADADEFVREARRLAWAFHPRGTDNLGPLERYGDGILPWLADHVVDGALQNQPWCVRPCLLAIGGRAAFDTVLRATQDVPLLSAWLGRHPEGWAWLGDAASRDEAAVAGLTELATDDPGGCFDHVAAGLGEARARALFARLALRTGPDDERVRAAIEASPRAAIPRGPAVSIGELDTRFAAFEYPMWDNMNYFTGGMRVTGFASPTGDALVFQALSTGLGVGDLRRELHVYSPVVAYVNGWNNATPLLEEDEVATWDEPWQVHHLTGVRTSHPDGVQVPEGGPRRAAAVPRLGLPAVLLAPPDDLADDERALLWEQLGPDAMLLVRLGHDHADAAYLKPAELAVAAGLPADATALFEFDAFAMPVAGDPAHDSPDLVAMVEALRVRARLVRLPVGGRPLDELLSRLRACGGWGSVEAWGRTTP